MRLECLLVLGMAVILAPEVGLEHDLRQERGGEKVKDGAVARLVSLVVSLA